MVVGSRETIMDMPRRPTVGDATVAALLFALGLGLLTKDVKAAALGGALGGALASKKQPLEMAVREYFRTRQLEVQFFYRSPLSMKVTFSYAPNAFWTVETSVPEGLQFSSDEDRDDYLYGSLIKKELPKVLRKIHTLLAQ
jgi:hypothetical protein